MSRDPYRSSGDVGRGERWDRERFTYERDRDRYGDEHEHIHFEEDDRSYSRDSRGPPPRGRDSSPGDRFDRRPAGRREDDYVRERRYYYDEEPRLSRPPPPRSPPAEYERKVVIEKEKIRSPSPPRRPVRPGTLLRRQSSLDTFDRIPPRFYEQERQERYGPPARRDDVRPPPSVPIPLPRTRALPPPRRYDDIRVSDPDYYGDDEFRAFPERAERVREKEIIRTRRRDRSLESRSTHSHHHHHHHHSSTVRSSSRSSSTSSRSSSSSGHTTVKSEYPKKGKTRIPARLVSKRALSDLGYPFVEEGNTIVVQKALGQDNIDDLLKLSENYKKSEAEMTGGRGEIIEERREEIIMAPGPVHHHHPPPPPVMIPGPPPPPIIHHHPPPPPPVEVVNTTTVIRDVSPARSATTTTTATTSRTPVVYEARPREISDEMVVGPLALVAHEHSHSRHRSHSIGGRTDREIRSEIRDLERQLARRPRHSERELVAAERLSNGELVLYEERIEKIEEPRRGVRIEKDKKGPPPGLVRAMLATLT